MFQKMHNPHCLAICLSSNIDTSLCFYKSHLLPANTNDTFSLSFARNILSHNILTSSNDVFDVIVYTNKKTFTFSH